jgi:hypothetical protein
MAASAATDPGPMIGLLTSMQAPQVTTTGKTILENFQTCAPPNLFLQQQTATGQ